jgi:hypothetical protein
MIARTGDYSENLLELVYSWLQNCSVIVLYFSFWRLRFIGIGSTPKFFSTFQKKKISYFKFLQILFRGGWGRILYCFTKTFIFSSPVLKAQVSFSDHRLSVFRLSVNFYIFDFFSRTTGPILTRLGTDHPWGEGSQVYSNEGDRPSTRGDNGEIVKTGRSNWIKLGTNYPWVKGIQVCSNNGSGPLQRGDNRKNGVGSPEPLSQF